MSGCVGKNRAGLGGMEEVRDENDEKASWIRYSHGPDYLQGVEYGSVVLLLFGFLTSCADRREGI